MAQVNIELSHDTNCFELNAHKKCDELFNDFEKDKMDLLQQILELKEQVSSKNKTEKITKPKPTGNIASR